VHRWDEPGLPALTDYFGRLRARPSVTRTVDAARAWRHVFPLPWPDHAD
jgi:glutathione S-transferase